MNSPSTASFPRIDARLPDGRGPASVRPAVVFGLNHAGLALARSLGRRGVPVAGVALREREFGLHSRYVARRYLVGAADGDEADERVLAALREVAPDGRLVLFPEYDENVDFVLRRFDEVRELADLPLPDDADVVHRLRRKDLLPAEAAHAGVPVPATVAAESEEAIRTAGVRPPFVLKPVEGKAFALTFGEKAIVAADVEEAVAAWRKASREGFALIVQELVPDAYDRIFSLLTYIGRDGEPLGSVVGRKVRQGPLRFGTATVFEASHDARVLELGLKLLTTAGYRGFAQVEFAHDRTDDSFKLLEVNTRVPIWAGIAMNGELDLARIAYDDLVGQRPGAHRVFTGDGCWIYLAKDAWVSAQMTARRELRFTELVAPYVRGRKVRSLLAADDLRPAAASVAYLASRVSLRLSRRR